MSIVINTGSQSPEQTAAPEGHDQQMVDALEEKQKEVEQLAQPKQEPIDSKEKILGKFESHEDLEKAYQELERKLSEQGQKPEENAKDGQEQKAAISEDKAVELIRDANIDIRVIAEHYYENGGITEEHYSVLEKAGITRPVVENYLRGVEAESNQLKDQLFTEIGGEDTFKAMSQWAVTNLSQEELTAYNKAVESGNVEDVRFAVMSMAYKYEKASGKEPELLRGTGKPASVDTFESLAQLTDAMKDPRYKSDPAYRAQVQQKLSNSNIL